MAKISSVELQPDLVLRLGVRRPTRMASASASRASSRRPCCSQRVSESVQSHAEQWFARHRARLLDRFTLVSLVLAEVAGDRRVVPEAPEEPSDIDADTRLPRELFAFQQELATAGEVRGPCLDGGRVVVVEAHQHVELAALLRQPTSASSIVAIASSPRPSIDTVIARSIVASARVPARPRATRSRWRAAGSVRPPPPAPAATGPTPSSERVGELGAVAERLECGDRGIDARPDRVVVAVLEGDDREAGQCESLAQGVPRRRGEREQLADRGLGPVRGEGCRSARCSFGHAGVDPLGDRDARGIGEVTRPLVPALRLDRQPERRCAVTRGPHPSERLARGLVALGPLSPSSSR